MKQCPSCQSQYTDDTLQFCLQDGTPLRSSSTSQMPTVAYGEQETVISNRQSNQTNAPRETQPTNWQPNQFPSNSVFTQPPKGSNASIAFILTAFVLVLFFGLVGVGAWLYLKGATPDPNGNMLLAKKDSNSGAANSSSTAPTNSSKTTSKSTPLTNSSNTVSTPPPIDTEQIKKDVSARVYTWKSAAEAHNLDSYMSNYAGTVNYYNKTGASVATVRSDKQRAFTAYDSLQVTISNLSVTPDATGERATAVFDKEWNFSGTDKYSSGKVKQQLELKKVSGQWLISGEKDLKLYYKE